MKENLNQKQDKDNFKFTKVIDAYFMDQYF